MPIAPGTKLGPYVVQDFIGQGAMGVVYRAYHAQLERTGAVKVLQGLGADPDSTARFRREAQAIARMRHPNVLNVFDFGEYEGTPYMIVEYVEGGNLAAVVKSGPLDRKVALGYLRGIAGALDYAHSRGIVHRDVKPANVLLGAESTPILADFGLAKLMQSSSVKSLTGVTTGTPAYMAPEQVTGSQVGPAADRYSLAVMAYEMLTGFLPFDEGGVLEVLYAQVHREPEPPSARNRRLGPRVDAVILRGMAKDPHARWDRCETFIAALDAALSASATPAAEKTVAFVKPMPSPTLSAKAAPKPMWAGDVAGEQPAGTIRGPDPIVAMHPPVITRSGVVVPASTEPPRPSRRRVYVTIGVAVILVLLLASAVVYEAMLPTTLTVSPNAAAQGSTISVAASHLPPNQTGEIHLMSALSTFAFTADWLGNVNRNVDLPSDIAPGDHLLQICWGGSCHAQIHLLVIAPFSVPTPSPSESPSASPSAPASPTPRSSPTPLTPAIALSNPTIRLRSGTETVSGAHFSPGSTVTITFLQGANAKVVGTAPVNSSGTFLHLFPIPSNAVLGGAYIRVCDAGCLYLGVTVV